jgi:short-subunit dehydrogenase
VARDGLSHYGRFEEKSITIAVNVITIIVAAVFLIGSIVGFTFVESRAGKLTMIASFTGAFAASIGLITNARRVEIFAATAA